MVKSDVAGGGRGVVLQPGAAESKVGEGREVGCKINILNENNLIF